MRAQPGELLKSPTAGSSTLEHSPQLRRLTEHLRDLITIVYERSISRRMKSLTLIRLEYVSGEDRDGKFFMHFVALVKDREAAESIPLRLTITAERDDTCSDQF